MKSRRVTIQRVAEKAGVTRTTVSLALRSDPRIPARTREKIQELADGMGYRPDPMLSALAKYRNRVRDYDQGGVILFLIHESLEKGSLPSWLQHLVRGIQNRGLKLGYTTTVFSMPDNGGKDTRINHILHHRGIRSLIVGPMPQREPELNLSWENYTSVAIGEHAGNPGLHLVRPDYFENTITAMHHVMAGGYRRIGYVVSEGTEKRFDHQWLAAYLKEKAICAGRTVFLPPLYRSGAEALRNWIGKHRPDCILTLEPAVSKHLERLKIALPGDVGLCHLATESSAHPNVSGIFQNLEQVGETAVEMMHNLLLRDERGAPIFRQRILISGQWVNGETI
ncbi:MAG: LacI family DNA-binding transcriptional regulator [Terrimicrobiaceae bacterium]